MAASSAEPRCECPKPGWCKRHNMRKSPHLWALCQTRRYLAFWDARAKGGSAVGSSRRRRAGANARQTGARPKPPIIGDDRIIVIAGLHCSLSSCLAEVLEILGVYMGPRTRGGEDAELRYYLESAMPFPRMQKPLTRCSVKAKFKGWIERRLREAKGRRLGMKYPHLCAFLGELAEVWPKLQVIDLDRDLETSIRSLADRSKGITGWPVATAEECDGLQRFLYMQKQAFIGNFQHYRVSAEELLSSPGSVIDGLVRWLGLTPTSEARQRAVAHVQPRRSVHSQIAPKGPKPDWRDVTTVVVKTFERPDALDKCLASIDRWWPGAKILIADDSRNPDRRALWLPYDIGLSAGRNFLTMEAKTPLVLLCDDDFLFTEETDIVKLYDALMEGDWDLVAGEARRRSRGPIVASMAIDGQALRVTRLANSNPGPIAAHWIPNFFLARREALRRLPWDDRLKLGEHLEWCVRAWQAGLRSAYLASVKVSDGECAAGPTYKHMRRRANGLYLQGMTRLGKRLGFAEVRDGLFPRNGIRQANGALPKIPKILHQVWIGPNPLPEEQRGWIARWKAMHPGWQHRLWDEPSAKRLLWDRLYPWYDRAGSWAMKADLLRLAIVYAQGGVYLDTDFEPLRPIDELLDGTEAWFAQEEQSGIIANAVFGAVPSHPILGEALRSIPQYLRPQVGNSTGPPMMTAVVTRLRHVFADEPRILPTSCFYPISYRSRHRLQSPCDFGSAYAVHHFAATWCRPREEI